MAISAAQHCAPPGEPGGAQSVRGGSERPEDQLPDLLWTFSLECWAWPCTSWTADWPSSLTVAAASWAVDLTDSTASCAAGLSWSPIFCAACLPVSSSASLCTFTALAVCGANCLPFSD